MPAELTVPVGWLWGFLTVLARVGGVFVFVPVPGLKKGPETARAVFALAFTLALFPRWPRLEAAASAGTIVMIVAAEAALGITIGVAVGFLVEAFLLAAQALGLQAGFSYASMINPNTEDESSVLLVLAQLTASLLFFATGCDRQVLGALAASLEACPPGGFLLSRPAAEIVIGMGAAMFSTGLRLAFPVIAMLLLVDVGLALLGRLQPGLQLITLAFPVKMLASLALLAAVAALFPKVFTNLAGAIFGSLHRALGF